MPADSACTLLANSWNPAAMEISSSRTLGLLVSLAYARQTAASLRRSSTLSDIAHRHADLAHRYAKCPSLVPETTSRDASRQDRVPWHRRHRYPHTRSFLASPAAYASTRR